MVKMLHGERWVEENDALLGEGNMLSSVNYKQHMIGSYLSQGINTIGTALNYKIAFSSVVLIVLMKACK